MLQKITALLLPARTWLDMNGGPGTAFGVLIVSVFLAVYGLRKWAPTAKLWERIANVIPSLNFDMTPGLAFLRKAWQGVIPTVFAAVAGALASGGNVKVALIAALAGPITVFGHEFAKWLPFLPYTGAVHPAALPAKKVSKNDDDDGDGGDSDVSPIIPPRAVPSGPPPAAALSALRATACFALALMLGGCVGWKPVVKDIDTAAVILCDIFFGQQPQSKGLSPADVEKAFCATAEQVAPFLDSAKRAVARGGAIRLERAPQ